MKMPPPKDPDLEKVASDIKTAIEDSDGINVVNSCLLYTSPSPRDRQKSRMPSSA